MQYIAAIAIAITLYFLQDSYYRNHWDDNLSVTIDYNKSYSHIGDEVKLTETITNRKRLPLSVLFAKFHTSKSFVFEQSDSSAISDHYYRNDAFSILGNQQITRILSFRVTKRGYYTIDSVHLVAKDLFLTKTYAAVSSNTAALYVYPMLLTNQKELNLTHSIIGDLITRNLYEDPLSFRGIRDYHSGDSMRYINWKSSARNGRLQVNTFFASEQSHVALFVNLDTLKPGHTERLKEYILSIAATLIQQMISYGFSVSLHINLSDPFTRNPLSIAEGMGTEHLHTLFQGISRVDINDTPVDFISLVQTHRDSTTKANENISYIILSNYRNPDLLNCCKNIQDQGYSLSFICPDYPASCKPASIKLSALSNVYFWEITNDEI